MKKNKAISQPGISVESEASTIHSGVSKRNVVLIVAVCLLIRFILGATVAILKTTKGKNIVGPSEEPQREASIEREEEIKLLKAALEKDPNDLQALLELGNACFDAERYQEAIDAYSNALGLGYLGGDLVIGKNYGPLLLELNARPGLQIQIANRKGLLERLEMIDRAPKEIFVSPEYRIAWATHNFAEPRSWRC